MVILAPGNRPGGPGMRTPAKPTRRMKPGRSTGVASVRRGNERPGRKRARTGPVSPASSHPDAAAFPTSARAGFWRLVSVSAFARPRAGDEDHPDPIGPRRPETLLGPSLGHARGLADLSAGTATVADPRGDPGASAGPHGSATCFSRDDRECVPTPTRRDTPRTAYPRNRARYPLATRDSGSSCAFGGSGASRPPSAAGNSMKKVVPLPSSLS